MDGLVVCAMGGAGRRRVQLGNKQLHHVVRCMGKSGPDWVTYPSRALGMARVVYHPMEDEEPSDMLNHDSETPFFAAMRYDEFFGKEFQSCPMVLHCYWTGRNDELNAKLWWMICSETQKLIPREKFSLQVTSRKRVKLGFSEASHYKEWQRDAMPELIVRGLKFMDDRTDQEIGEYGGLSDTDTSISSSCSEGQGAETFIVYDVQPWMKKAEVRSIFSATKAAEPKRLRPVSWMPGDTDLAAWRVQNPGVEASITSVNRDGTTGQNVYVISLRQYSSWIEPSKLCLEHNSISLSSVQGWLCWVAI